eukprot:jgi/Hompol1/4979/HPOL_004062-RA
MLRHHFSKAVQSDGSDSSTGSASGTQDLHGVRGLHSSQKQSQIDKELVMNVLGALPTKREARSFLKRFNVGTLLQEQRVGLFRLGKDLSLPELDRAAKSLIQLHHLGLFPIVVLSNPIPDRQSLGYQSEQNPLKSSMTPTQVMQRDAFIAVEAIERAGGFAEPLVEGVFTINDTTIDSDVSRIERAILLDKIPIISCLANDPAANRMVPIACRSAIISLAKEATRVTSLSTPIKFIIVSEHGGLHLNSNHISFVNLAADYESLHAMLRASGSSDGATLMDDVDLIKDVLKILPSRSSALLSCAATSVGLISNLITDKPLSSLHSVSFSSSQPSAVSFKPQFIASSESLNATTHRSPRFPPTVFRNGFNVDRHTSLATIDRQRLAQLLERSFQRTLNVDAYFERLESVFSLVLVAGDYDGAVVVTRERNVKTGESDLYYMDKFAVDPSNQGMGISDILWSRLKVDAPNLSWRSRTDNPVNKWYFERSDGTMSLSGGRWTLFWYGPDGLQLSDAYSEMASRIPASFMDSTKASRVADMPVVKIS